MFNCESGNSEKKNETFGWEKARLGMVELKVQYCREKL